MSGPITNGVTRLSIFHDDTIPPERVAFFAHKRSAFFYFPERVVLPQLQHFLCKTGIGVCPIPQLNQTSAEIMNPTGNDLGDFAIIQPFEDFFQDLLTPSSPDHPPEIQLLHWPVAPFLLRA